ncbi:MAG: hypothetical protein HFF63_00235 [Oscillospiraceae bacterium]|mgnify:FL=1|jgi:hypothetical protein|nr:hypothetical protein [Oscillospiraceae bacterium]
MAYNVEKLTKLKALKQLAERIQTDFATKRELSELSGRVEDLVTAGGEPNVITAVKVNGTAQTVTDKAVDIAVPVSVSQLTNDSGYQTEAQVAAAVAGADHLRRKKVESAEAIDPAAADADQFIYMVPKGGGENGDKFDEYMVIDGAVEKVGDWAVDLSGYVLKEAGKGLSANDYTSAEKAKLAGVAEGAVKVEAGAESGSIRINGVETAVVEIAADAEVTEMLTEVFGQAN